jgi:hypothetical protein
MKTLHALPEENINTGDSRKTTGTKPTKSLEIFCWKKAKKKPKKTQ